MKPSLTDTAFAALVSDPDVADAILGDLEELRAERAAERGRGAARRWYWRELARSVPALLHRRLRQAPVKIMLSVLLGLLAAGAVHTVITLAMSPLQAVAGPAAAFFLGPIAGHLIGGAVAGALIARVNRVAPLAAALWIIPGWILWILLGLIVSMIMFTVAPTSAPASVAIGPGAAVPDLSMIIGVMIGALLAVLRPSTRARRVS